MWVEAAMVEATADVRPARKRYVLGADGFLFTGVLFMAVNLVIEGVWSLVGDHAPALEWINMVFMVGAALGGAALTWRIHARPFHKSVWIALAVGTLIIGPPVVMALVGLMSLGRFIPNPIPSVEGPWGLVFLVSAAVIGALVFPVVDAVRELRTRREHVARAWLRLAALLSITSVVIGSFFVGGEAAEIGLFMVLFAFPGVCGVLVADLVESRRQGREAPVPA